MPIAFTCPGSDAFPVDMFHLRRGLVGGTLARSWLAWTDTVDGLRVMDLEHGGSAADPTTFVASLASAIRTPVVLDAGTQTPAQVAASIAAALVLDGVQASADGATVTIAGATDLVVPPAVDMTDESLRGMWGGQRDDWGDGAAGHSVNQNGGTGGTGNVHLGQIGTAGRILGVYLWTRTDTVATVVRLAASTGPAYSTTPGAMTPLMQGVATIQGFGGIADAAVSFGATDRIWAQYRSNTATAGIRFRAHGGTPVGRGQLGAGEVLVWDTTSSASSGTAFGATYTPSADATFNIYVMIGVVFELPDGSGNYPANGALTALIGDHNPDPDHGTQFEAGPGILSGETTHHRQNVLPWTDVDAVSVSRTIGDTASGEDSRAVFYGWDDLSRPSTTPADRIADLGPMGFTAGAGNRVFTLNLPTPVPVGSDAIANTYWSLGFNYATASGAAISTLTLPVYLDDAAGDSGWLDCWADDRETWHDDIRGANNYAPAAGVTEYRTRVSAGNNGMPTTDVDVVFPVTFATDPSDDSPSAIAADWVIVERVGFVEVEIPTYPLAGDATVDGAWSMAADVIYPISGAGTAAGAWSMEASPVYAVAGDASAGGSWSMEATAIYELGGDASAAGSWAMDAGAVYPLAGEATVTGSWSMDAMAVPDLDDLLGAAGSELALSVMGVDQYGVLQMRARDPRPVRFELLDAEGVAIDHDVIESLTVQVRRASSPPGSATLTPTAETEGSGDDVYTWAVDISTTVTVSGMWILEVDVVLVDGREATWPSAGPLRIRAAEPVD
jgi:hypothetical protein